MTELCALARKHALDSEQIFYQVSIHTYIHTYMQKCVLSIFRISHTYIQIIVQGTVYTYTSIHTSIHTYMHTYMHTNIQYIHPFVIQESYLRHTYIHTYIHVPLIFSCPHQSILAWSWSTARVWSQCSPPNTKPSLPRYYGMKTFLYEYSICRYVNAVCTLCMYVYNIMNVCIQYYACMHLCMHV